MIILPDDHPILTERMPEIDFSDSHYVAAIRQKLDEMFYVMRQHNGVGLAAPQVGIRSRFFIMEIAGTRFVCCNPVIVSENLYTETREEGCLSFPQLYLKIARPVSVDVTYHDEHGQIHSRSMEGLGARCFSHELDHLNGVRFVDHVSKLKLSMALKRRMKRG